MRKKKSQRFLGVFMKRFPDFESMRAAGNVNYRHDVYRNMMTVVDKLKTFKQILVTSEAEVDAVEQLVNMFSYTGEVRFPTKLDADLKETLETIATEKGLKVSKGQKPPPEANRE